MREILDVIVQSYLGGISFILIGLIWFRFQCNRKKTGSERNEFRADIKGFAGSIFIFTCGILIIILKLYGKL
jgi:hypothetical protein